MVSGGCFYSSRFLHKIHYAKLSASPDGGTAGHPRCSSATTLSSSEPDCRAGNAHVPAGIHPICRGHTPHISRSHGQVAPALMERSPPQTCVICASRRRRLYLSAGVLEEATVGSEGGFDARQADFGDSCRSADSLVQGSQALLPGSVASIVKRRARLAGLKGDFGARPQHGCSSKAASYPAAGL